MTCGTRLVAQQGAVEGGWGCGGGFGQWKSLARSASLRPIGICAQRGVSGCLREKAGYRVGFARHHSLTYITSSSRMPD
jgi:hypothetical protein